MPRLKLTALLPLIASTIIFSCQPEIPLVKPPFEGVTNDWYNASFEASAGHTTTFPNGTEISIPKNAFVDENGNTISGNVDFKFQEISSVDQVLTSGIQMTTNNENREVMVSADMFELRAYQNGKELQLGNGKTIKTALASNEGSSEYDFYFLNEQQKDWDLLGAVQPEENQRKINAKNGIDSLSNQLEDLDMENVFALNYLPLIDLADKPLPRDKNFNYHNYRNDPSFAVLDKLVTAKLMKYGAKWIFGFDNKQVRYKGKLYHSSMVLWQAEKPIPNWISKKRYEYAPWSAYNANVVKLKSGKYSISITEYQRIDGKWPQKTIFSTLASIKMPLKELYQSSPTHWSEEIQRLEEEAMKLKQVHETQNLFVRTFEVASMGIYNYDRIKKNEQIMVSIDLELDGQKFDWNSSMDLYTVPKGDNTVIRYHNSQRDKFVIYPDQDMLVFTVLDNNKIGLLDDDFFKSLNYQSIKSSGNTAITLPLKSSDIIIKSQQDVMIFLGKNEQQPQLSLK